MAAHQPKRFYQTVSVSRAAGGYGVSLDGKPLKTPAGAELILPAPAVAEAIADEWRAQGEKMSLDTMTLTKLANAGLDRVATDRKAAIEQILRFARSETLCYRADAPKALVQRQGALWDPLLEWARVRYGAALACVAGITHVEQPPDALSTFEQVIAEEDNFSISGLASAAALTGSLVIALALLEGRLDAEQAFAASQLDEIFQAERWGWDFEAEQRSRTKATELAQIGRFLRLLRNAALSQCQIDEPST